MSAALATPARKRSTVAPLLLSALVMIGLGGCAAPTTVVTELAQAAFEDRTTEDQITDNKIRAGIFERLSETDKSLLLDLSVDVWEGRVLITGVLDDGDLRKAAVRQARNDQRITSFNDAIVLVSKDEKETRRTWKEKAEQGMSDIGDSANDFWIEAKIKGRLVAAEDVKSVNYRWRSVDGTVYIIGRAGSTTELNTVLHILRQTEGVKDVESYIRVQTPS